MMLLSCLVYALLFYLLLIFSWIKRKIRHFFVYYIDLHFCSFLHKLRKGLVTRTDCLMIQLLLYWARLIFFFFVFLSHALGMSIICIVSTCSLSVPTLNIIFMSYIYHEITQYTIKKMTFKKTKCDTKTKPKMSLSLYKLSFCMIVNLSFCSKFLW